MPAGVEKIATGHFKVATRGRISRITQAQISSIQNVVYPRTWLLVSKTTTLNGLPAAEFKVYNQAGELSNATVDVLLRGIVAA